MLSKYKDNTSWVVIVGAVMIGVLVDLLPDAVFFPVFCDLPAFFASRYYNADLMKPELVFSVREVVVQVTRGCGASGFFAMCAALLLARLWQSHNPATGGSSFKWMFAAALALGMAWTLTLAVNSARIVCIIPVTASSLMLPERIRGSVHMFAGMLVFMGSFIALWVATEFVVKKRKTNEHSRQRER